MVVDNSFVISPRERFSLNAQSPVPLYYQMEQILLERIARPEMVGRKMPSEFELIDMFGVSRATVKKTLDNMVNKGLLERRRGVGTRVIKHQIIEDLARLKSYTEEMVARNVAIETHVLETGRHAPAPEVARKLALGRKDKSLFVRRLRGTSEVFPVVLLHSEVPVEVGLEPTEDFTGSLYSLLEQKHGVSIIWGEETIEAAKATEEEARYLEVEPDSPVLIMERVSYTHGNRPVEYVRAVYRPDRYKFSIRLNR
jgi:GntR family transcriptional regulator